jgi:Putative RNA methylase family UPF0020
VANSVNQLMPKQIRRTPEPARLGFESRRAPGGVDTSLLYDELKSQFRKASTPIEVDFRQLVSWVRLGDQFTHQLHPYPAKLLPHIANFFIRAKSVRGGSGLVLDPFCGSGTVALEASLAGLMPMVVDANPFALLLTKVKTYPYDVQRLHEELKKVVGKLKRYKTAPTIDIVNPEIWYKKEHREKLNVLARAIAEIAHDDERDFFRIAFSLAAKKVSFSDPAVSVPVRIKVKPNISQLANEKIKARLRWIDSLNVVDEFFRIGEQNIQRVAEANAFMPDRAVALQVGCDARNICGLPDKVDGKASSTVRPSLILTSPPYGSAQKYIRASSLSLNWLELASPKKLSELEGVSIGREHLPRWLNPGSVEIDNLPPRYEDLIRKISSINTTRAKITRQYLLDMRDSVVETVRVMPVNGHAVFVIGNNTVSGEALCNDNFLVDVCRSNGLNLELSLIDNIKSRGLMTKRNQTASVIAKESVLVFKKN